MFAHSFSWFSMTSCHRYQTLTQIKDIDKRDIRNAFTRCFICDNLLLLIYVAKNPKLINNVAIIGIIVFTLTVPASFNIDFWKSYFSLKWFLYHSLWTSSFNILVKCLANIKSKETNTGVNVFKPMVIFSNHFLKFVNYLTLIINIHFIKILQSLCSRLISTKKACPNHSIKTTGSRGGLL